MNCLVMQLLLRMILPSRSSLPIPAIRWLRYQMSSPYPFAGLLMTAPVLTTLLPVLSYSGTSLASWTILSSATNLADVVLALANGCRDRTRYRAPDPWLVLPGTLSAGLQPLLSAIPSTTALLLTPIRFPTCSSKNRVPPDGRPRSSVTATGMTTESSLTSLDPLAL
jgi:hypothetical protein